MSPDTSQQAVEIVPFADLEERRELWERLAARSRNVFACWEWASTWWRHFGRPGEPAFAECRRDGEPFAILPLQAVARGPVRALRLLGHGPGDVLGPICDPADAEIAGTALRQALDELPGHPALLLAERLPGGPVADAFGGKLLLREANPSLTIAGQSWDEYLAARSRNLREKVGRGARKVERKHEVSYRLLERPEELEARMGTLLRLHRARWGEGTNFAEDAAFAFHRELAAAMLAAGRLRLWTMEVDGAEVAAWYGFRYEGIESFYQSGRDRSYDKLSVGFLLLARTIQAAFDDGIERYDFLRGNEPYKDRFADSDPGLETRVLGRGPLGRGLVLAAGAVLGSPRLRRVSRRLVR
ncbi:MAG TPA: GNAT family N-acetyltransferase [Solirubrobacterales bacterium]|nr:GNAT family N-acetyltransferase [Solirubrobacterales bacterium]